MCDPTQPHYSHGKRESNKVAHSLARYVMHISNFIMLMKNVSPQFISVFQADLVEIS